mmetsp:Transcript_454/g.829  ORF Transcript_454/g.829 Transcript_454/m.829 type:complete len:88 (-) Transcript_454:715-978(-)
MVVETPLNKLQRSFRLKTKSSPLSSQRQPTIIAQPSFPAQDDQSARQPRDARHRGYDEKQYDAHHGIRATLSSEPTAIALQNATTQL